ncbi:MAG: formylglycine-generating enzyme family protein, partial [Bacteroidota bacterium]
LLVKYGLVKVDSGVFKRGDNQQYEVYLDSFSIGSYEVTNLAYAIFLNRYGSNKVKTGEYSRQKMIYESVWGLTNNDAGIWEVSTEGYDFHPVVSVTWYGANEFCKFYGGHLPTEAQWEYTARGGRETKGYRYAGSDEIEEVAWYAKNAAGTNGVGLKKPNELVLYDMSGNVWEWCSDWYAEGYYSSAPRENPTGPTGGTLRVLRGGSWHFFALLCTVSHRNRYYPSGNISSSYGFRFAL